MTHSLIFILWNSLILSIKEETIKYAKVSDVYQLYICYIFLISIDVITNRLVCILFNKIFKIP